MRKEILPRTTADLLRRVPAATPSSSGRQDGGPSTDGGLAPTTASQRTDFADHTLPAAASDFAPLRRVSDWDEEGAFCPRLQRFSPWWVALTMVVLVAVGTLTDLFLLEGTSNLHLRAATLRAAGGSAQIGAQGIFIMRLVESVVVWTVLCLARGRGCDRGKRTLISGGGGSSQGGGGGGGVCGTDGAAAAGGRVAAAPRGAAALPALGSGIASDPPPTGRGRRDRAEQSVLRTQGAPARRNCGADLLCTLSGWVWVLLGCFALFGSVCSLLVAMGGRTDPGMLGELFSHHGPLGRRSIIGRSLPALTWLSFEVGSAGALYIATLSLIMLLRATLLAFLASRSRSSEPSALSARVQSCARLCAAGGAEPPLAHKLRSLVVHALALVIAFAELWLNDLPVLPQHRPLALLMGCAFSLNLLGWHARHGRFTYLYAASVAAPYNLSCCPTPTGCSEHGACACVRV